MNKSLFRPSTGLFIADQLMIAGSGLEEGNRDITTGLSALRIAESSDEIYSACCQPHQRL